MRNLSAILFLIPIISVKIPFWENLFTKNLTGKPIHWKWVETVLKSFPVDPTVNGYLALFKAGESEGGEEEVWYPTGPRQLHCHRLPV